MSQQTSVPCLCIVVYADASSGTYPGHMVLGQEPLGDLCACEYSGVSSSPGHMILGQESPSGERRYFGYRFDPDDLPPEFQSPEKWRQYLFTNTVPGKIVDETAYVIHKLKLKAWTHVKRIDWNSSVESELPPPEQWKPHAQYTFSPDDFPAEQQPCYNCVKWAITIANKLIDSFLPAIDQWRIKNVLPHLQKTTSITLGGPCYGEADQDSVC